MFETARRRFTPIRSLHVWGRSLGPGLITGASDDDPSGILTYLQAGAVLGFRSLWTVILTLPLMYGVQEMCGRIGYTTRKGLIRLIKERYARPVLYAITFISFLVIVMNIGADILAMGVVLEHLSGLNRLAWLPVLAIVIISSVVFFSYRRFARILKWTALSLLFYVLVALYIQLDWASALKATFTFSFTFSKEWALIVAAILGTTISPYLFFWQANEEIEEGEEQDRTGSRGTLPLELRHLKYDTLAGMVFSNLATWFIIASASQLRADHGLSVITSFDQAALVLQPLLGNFAYLAFSLGILGTGLLAIPVLAGSVGYGLAETFNWNEGMNKKFGEARGFYLAIAGATLLGMLLTFLGFDPVSLLVYTAVFYTLITPPLIFIILRLGRDKELLGVNVNGRLSNFLGYLALAGMSASAAAYLVSLL